MNPQEILRRIGHDANSFHLAAADALPAFAEILAEMADHLSEDDLTTLIAIGSVLHREADAGWPAPREVHGSPHRASPAPCQRRLVLI